MRKKDWKALIGRIKKKGLTDAEIAKKVRTSQQNISRIKLGTAKEPFWGLGDRLIRFEKKLRQRPPVKTEGNIRER